MLPNDPPVRILVVEHYTLLRKGLVNLLSHRREFEIAGEAAHGRQALRKARRLTPDLSVPLNVALSHTFVQPAAHRGLLHPVRELQAPLSVTRRCCPRCRRGD
jgi:CheY-like chemotaxis protein